MLESSKNELILSGLDGANPLGFLSAIGVFAVAAGERPSQVKLSWEEQEVWHPVIHFTSPIDEDALSELLIQGLKSCKEELGLGDNLVVPLKKFREHAIKIIDSSSINNRAPADLMANFGCDVCGEKDNGKLVVSSFCFLKGSGHQEFLKTAKQLLNSVDKERVRRCLFEPWTYDDIKLSMRWDPVEDRRYALMWNNPSTVESRTVWAANLLAYRGLQLFPSVLKDGRLKTTGFNRKGKQDFFTWPIWNAPLSVDSVRSLLALKELTVDTPDRIRLNKMGIREVNRSERIRVGKFVNFGPSGSV